MWACPTIYFNIDFTPNNRQDFNTALPPPLPPESQLKRKDNKLIPFFPLLLHINIFLLMLLLSQIAPSSSCIPTLTHVCMRSRQRYGCMNKKISSFFSSDLPLREKKIGARAYNTRRRNWRHSEKRERRQQKNMLLLSPPPPPLSSALVPRKNSSKVEGKGGAPTFHKTGGKKIVPRAEQVYPTGKYGKTSEEKRRKNSFALKEMRRNLPGGGKGRFIFLQIREINNPRLSSKGKQ